MYRLLRKCIVAALIGGQKVILGPGMLNRENTVILKMKHIHFQNVFKSNLPMSQLYVKIITSKHVCGIVKSKAELGLCHTIYAMINSKLS